MAIKQSEGITGIKLVDSEILALEKVGKTPIMLCCNLSTASDILGNLLRTRGITLVTSDDTGYGEVCVANVVSTTVNIKPQIAFKQKKVVKMLSEVS